MTSPPHFPARAVADPPAWAAPVVLLGAVLLFALLPLLREPSFYYWDDTSAVFVPTWRAAGLDLLAGRWPTMRPDFWMGGNWAAEAQFGLWSPVNLAICVVVALLPDLAVAGAVVKISLMLVLALGAFLLLRQYGVRPAWAVALASALPFGGFSLWYDASTWVAGFAAFAWTPWFWWAARSALHAAANPLVVYVAGYLLVTNGNPYGVVAAVVVLAATAVEGVATRRWRGLGHLVLAGACVGTTVAVAYLPMFLTAGVGWRGESARVANDGQLVPDLSMLAATSSPSLFPFLHHSIDRDPLLAGSVPASGSTVPAVFTAWFLVPLLAWLPSRRLRGRRDLVGIAVVAVFFTALTLAPSQLWMFRWPLRLLPYAFMAATVALGVLASQPRSPGRARVRLALSLATVLAGSWIAYAHRPDLAGRHLAGTVVAVALTAALGFALARRPRLAPTVLVLGTGLVLALQLAWAPANRDVMNWYFPTDAGPTAYGERYADPVIQVSRGLHVPFEQRAAVYEHLLWGSQPGLRGIESTTSYTGIGFNEFSRALCLDFGGHTCPEAFGAVWAPVGTAVPVAHLADAVKARTVVVQNALVPAAATFDPPPGWTRGPTSDVATVFTRDSAPPWPDSRLAATAGDVAVASAVGTDTTERLSVSTGSAAGALQFARLAWPGYTATVDGRPLAVGTNAQGLIELELPAGLSDADVRLRFSPPGYGVAVPLLLIGLVGALTQAAVTRGAGRISPSSQSSDAPTT